MDFHDMKRRELQKLCKEHNIPANLSNLDMAEKLSSMFKVQEKEVERPMRKTRSCLKNSDEMLSENESDVLKRKSKKVRFSPQNDVFQLGKKNERGPVVDNEGGAGQLTRCRVKLAKTIMISPVVKKRGKRVVQEVEEEDVTENKGDTSRVTRTRASLGKSDVISSPVVMKKKGKRALHEDEKRDLAVENVFGASRVTRAKALFGEKVLTSPVVMKKRVKKAVQEDEKEDLFVENKGAASRVTRARAGNQVLISSPLVIKRKGKKNMQEDEKEDLVVENKGAPSRVTRARAGKQVLISSPVAMKKRGKKAVQKEKKSGSPLSLVVDFTDPAVEEEKEVITVKFLRSRKVENVVSLKNLTRKRNTQNKSQGVNVEVSENKDAKEGITQTRRSKRNRMELTQVEPLEENLDGMRNITRSRNQFQAKSSNIVRESETRDAREEAKRVVIQGKEPLRRSGRHFNTADDVEMPIKSDKSTWDQTRHGAKRKSVMPQMKKAKTEKPIAGKLGKKNVDPPNESTKPIVIEKGSETGHIRRSKRNASGDGLISENANGSGTDIKTGTTKKRKRDAVPEEVPSQHTGRHVNRKADNIFDKIEGKTPIASEPRTRSGNRQKSLIPSARKLNMSGNSRPSRTTGGKASPCHTRELSSVPKHSATGVKQSKIASVTPGMRSGSGKKSFGHTAKKLIVSGNPELHKSVTDKELPHQSRDISMVPRLSETELKLRGSRSKQTPVINEHPRRFTRSALKGKTDGPARVRGKIYQKSSQSVSKLPLSKLESSLPKVISASEGLDIDVQLQSSNPEVDRSTNNLAANAGDLPEDKTACSTPQGGSAKTRSIDLNLQESEGAELINIHEISSSDTLKLQSDLAELEVDISAREQAHAPSERPASHDVHSSIPQIAGCSLDHIFDTSNSCGGLDSYGILQDSATEGNDKTPVHTEPAEGLDVSGDAAFIDRNSVDDGFSSLEQIKSKGMEVNPQKVKYVEPSSEGITNIVLEESTVHEEPSMNQLLFPGDGCSTIPLSQTGDVDEDNTNATQPENSSESNVASPHLVHLTADDAGMDAFPNETNALADMSTSRRDEERPQLSKDVESVFKGIDLNIVFEGSAIHEDEPVYLSPLAEVAEITDNPVTASSDAACVTQQKGLTESDAKSPPPEITDDPVTANSDSACLTQQEGPPGIDAESSPLVRIESVDNVDIIGDAGFINAGTVLDNLFTVEQINSSAFKGKLEVSNNVNSVVADGSTVNEEKLIAEVSDCGPTGQELDICNHPAEFAESGELDKDSRSAHEVLGEASYAHLNNQTVSMIFTEEKDDTRHPEISEQADEPHNTSSKLGMQENELLVPNSIQANEEVLNFKYEFSKPEYFDTVMCSNKEFVDDSNQRLSAVEACFLREESCTDKCVEFSTSVVVADSVSGGNNTPEPKDPSLPFYVTEVGNLLVKVNEKLNSEEPPSNWSSDISERAAVYGSSLQKEQGTVISANVSDYVHSKDTNDKSEISKNISVLDSSSQEMSYMPKSISSLPSNVTKVDHVLAEVKEQKPEDSLLLSSPEIEPERASENCSSLHKDRSSVILDDDSGHNQPECGRDESEIRELVNRLDFTTKELTDMPEQILVFQTSEHNNGGNCTENDLSSSSISLKKMVASEVDTGLTSNQTLCARDESEISEKVNMLDSSTREFSNMPEYVSSQTSDQENGRKGKENNPSSSSISLKKMVVFEVDTELTSEGQEYQSVIIGGREVEETLFEDIMENESNRTSSIYGDAHKTLDVEGEWDLQNISSESTLVVSEDDINRDGIVCPVIVQKFPSRADDHCHTPSDDSCGKEQDIDMSMVKSSRNFGEEFFSEHDIRHRPLRDSCGKEQGTPMSIVKSSRNCVERFSSQHDNVIEHVNVCGAETLPQAICEDFAGFDNQMVTGLMGSTGRRISRTGAVNNEKLEETDMNDVETDSNIKGICQENDESPILVQMDVDPNNLESSRDNLIAIQGCDQKVGASELLTKELPSYDDAMDSDALVNLQYGGERVTSEQTKETPGVCREELPGIDDANAPANLRYGHSGETNEDQEHESRSDKMVQEDLRLWYEDTSFIPEKSEVAEKEEDIFTASLTEEQLHNSGEEHAREKVPETIENQHAAFIYSSTGDDDNTLESADQKVDCRHDNKFDDDFARNGS